MPVKWWLLVSYYVLNLYAPIMYFLQCTGVSIAGLYDQLTVGQSATISCMTDIPADTIEWRDQSSSVLNMSIGMNTVVYTIPLVTDELHGQQVTCIAVAGNKMYIERVDIRVSGTWWCYAYTVFFNYIISSPS